MKERSLFLLYHLLAVLLLLSAACAGAEPVLLTPTSLPPTQTPMPSNTPRPSETPRPSDTPLPTITPEGEIGSTWVRAKDGMVMVYVPKGAFSMGSITGEPDEKPVRVVEMDAFWIDQSEVTYTMYARFVPARSGPQPVVNVSWEEASAYCAWVGSRLPTEAEWEKAARGTDERVYPWGNQPPAGDLVNFADVKSRLSWEDVNVDDGYGNVAPIGKYPAGASQYGALDMAGNVAEWVNDWYDESYYSTGPLNNPVGPAEGFFRVLRGGSWFSTAAGVRVSERSWYIPEAGADYNGFRCAQSTVMQ
ncbi:MAG: SUMF1/EgtB/PvdO family nonheme iron enzyme [Anaerolineales bacterium]|nr:SUMF1/EgtB/PvdO family nonheme iron enzyme [Anaerolineales bacterium]